jgi:hypothetical protein
MPELDEKKRIIAYDTVNDPDENYYALIDNGTAGTGKVSIKGLGPADMISDQYSDSSTYKVGDLCIHNNKLYVCTVAINTPHAFNLSEWELDTLGNYASQIKQSLSQLNSALSNKASKSWTLIDALQSVNDTLQFSLTANELLFMQYNQNGGTFFYSCVIPTASMPSVFAIYSDAGHMIVNRSGSTLTTASNTNNSLVRVFYR